jgi:aminomuconate-semialdehyde/2-hydroxymuconate-6-semialdehyde dehydrogenase
MTEFLPNFIDGKFLPSKTNMLLDNINPSTNVVYSQIPNSNIEDINLAVMAAKHALPKWSSVSIKDRSSLLNAIADEIEIRKEDIAKLEMIDCGKPFETALNVDIDRSIKNFRFFAQQIQVDVMESFQDVAGLNYSQRTPIGVCGLITPWNLPLYLLSWKVAPALACGNTVVCKPSELTPRTATELARIMNKLGIPKGVFNVVHGTGLNAGKPLVTHPDVNAISFTGGTKTGSIIGSLAGKAIKKMSLELGGKVFKN